MDVVLLVMLIPWHIGSVQHLSVCQA